MQHHLLLQFQSLVIDVAATWTSLGVFRTVFHMQNKVPAVCTAADI
jgi:hypothetical protein